MLRKLPFVLSVLVALGIGFLIGRFTGRPKPVDVVAKKVLDALEFGSFVHPDVDPVFHSQGDVFKLGQLDAKFADEVVCWYRGQVDEHYAVKVTLTNNTQGKLLSPQIISKSVKDNFENDCSCKTMEGSDSSIFGGSEDKELRPGESADFAVKIMPVINATEFKGSIHFGGTGGISWKDSMFYFRLNKSETRFTNRTFESENHVPPFIEIGDSYIQDGLRLTVKKVELKELHRQPKKDEDSPPVKCFVLTCIVENMSEKETRPSMGVEAQTHLGVEVDCPLDLQLPDDNLRPTKLGGSATMIHVIQAPPNYCAVYCEISVNKYWSSLSSSIECGLRLVPDKEGSD